MRIKNIIYFLILVLTMPLVFADCYGMMWPFGMGFSGLGFFFMLLFWVAVIWLIVWAISRYSKSESPLDILKKRYSKGEINKKQFEQMKKELI